MEKSGGDFVFVLPVNFELAYALENRLLYSLIIAGVICLVLLKLAKLPEDGIIDCLFRHM